ncbi:MAG: LOG family protein [Anaerolineales bacterium]
MHITIFGGAQPAPGAPAYQDAYELGKMLATAGHTILTGGYMGTMEAASRGASEAGGHVIGVTCADIEAWRPIKPNAWVKEELRCITLQERLNALIDGCEAAIALPGGAGTLAEVALTWNLMLIDPDLQKPLILVGPGWRSVFDEFFRSFDAYMPGRQRELLLFAPNVQAAAKLLESGE